MAVDKKVTDRIAKLLRLAAPGSGTSEPERASAALEAAKLIAENSLAVSEPPPPPPRKPRPAPAAKYAPVVTTIIEELFRTWTHRPPQHVSGYHAITVDHDVICGVCGKTIRRGEDAFFDQQQGTRCYNITCDEPTQ